MFRQEWPPAAPQPFGGISLTFASYFFEHPWEDWAASLLDLLPQDAGFDPNKRELITITVYSSGECYVVDIDGKVELAYSTLNGVLKAGFESRKKFRIAKLRRTTLT